MERNWITGLLNRADQAPQTDLISRLKGWTYKENWIVNEGNRLKDSGLVEDLNDAIAYIRHLESEVDQIENKLITDLSNTLRNFKDQDLPIEVSHWVDAALFLLDKAATELKKK